MPEKAEDLVKEEKIYSILVEKGNDGIIIIQDGLLKFINPKMSEITGFSPEEGLGKPFIDFAAPECAKSLKDRYEKRMAGEEVPSKYEIKIISKDKKKIPVEINASVIEYKGKPADMAIIRDITKRKKAEEELKSSEEWLKILFEYAPDAYYLYDSYGNFIDGNRAAEKLIGYKKSELIGKSFLKLGLLPKSQIPKAAVRLSKTIAGTRARPGEFTLNRKDGSKVQVEISSIQVKLKGKNVVLGIAREITERKLMERALVESEAKYRRIFEDSPVIIVAMDTTGRVVDTNQKAYEWLGYKPEEVIGKSFEELPFLPKETIPELKEKFGRRIKGEKILPYEVKHITKDGKKVTGRVACSQITNDAGKITGTIIITEDITREKQMVEALRESEEKFRLIFEHAKDAIFWADPETGLIINCNKAAETLLEKKKEEIMGLHQTKLHPPQKKEYYIEIFKRHIKEKGVVDEDAEVITKSGEIVPVHISANTTLIRGKPMMQGIFRDIAERKRMEQSLQESEAKYRDIAFHIPGIIYQFMIKKDGSRSFPYVSEGAREICGLEPEELMENPSKLFDIVLREDINGVNKTIAESARSMEIWANEFRIRTKRGEIKWVRCVATPRMMPDGSIIWNGTLLDITINKWAEEGLRRARNELERQVEKRRCELKQEIKKRKESERELRNELNKFKKMKQ